MYKFLFLIVFLWGSILCGMNSSENRQELFTIIFAPDAEQRLQQLFKEAYEEGNRESARAYEYIMDLVESNSVDLELTGLRDGRIICFAAIPPCLLTCNNVISVILENGGDQTTAKPQDR